MFDSTARPLHGADRCGLAPSACRIAIAGAVVLALAACAQPKTMYSWQSYQSNVYTYLKEDNSDYAVQAASLEKNVETARSADQALPPGFHAHLGMLYLKMGNGTKAVEQMQAEKAAFPESAPFMDFLLRNASAPAAGTAAEGLTGPAAAGAAKDAADAAGAKDVSGAAAAQGAKAPATAAPAPADKPAAEPVTAKGA